MADYGLRIGLSAVMLLVIAAAACALGFVGFTVAYWKVFTGPRYVC